MTSIAQSPARPATWRWAGRILTAVVALFLLADAVMHIVKPAPVITAFAQLGVPLRLAVPLGILELACVALYLLRRTTVLGAVLLTGYLGGAVATQARAGSPVFETLFPVIVGALVWGALLLRDEELLTVFPLRR